MKKKPGTVYLVGAGPGHPDLLTLRGAQCLERADAVVVDALVNRRILDLCPPGVRVIEAGKRGHGRVLMKQKAIQRLLARLALSGKTVVRLKGGDPYFFGRGGEEAEYLYSRGVPFEIVPGVSSVNAVPAYAGIPLTHRGLTSTVTVVTGHAGIENPYLGETRTETQRRRAPGVDWDRLSPQSTLVILMGAAQLPRIIDRLKRAGWPNGTPAAAVQWGTLPGQRTVQGTLADLVSRVKKAGLGAPALVLLGAVAALRPRLNWFEKLPLFGKTFVVTRAQGQGGSLARCLENQGGQAWESPAIRFEPIPPGRRGREILKGLSRYDGLIFTSVNGARIFLSLWNETKKSFPRGPAVYAIGVKTAQVLAEGGLPVRGIAPEFISESLFSLLGEVRGKRFLIPGAESGRDVLPRELDRAGARTDLWPLYRTHPQKMGPALKKALLAGQVQGVTFTSSSTARHFLGELSPRQRKNVFSKTLAASIGPVTSQTLRALGVRPKIQAARSTVEDLARAIVKKWA